MVTYYLRLFCKYDSCYFKILLISETKWFLLNMYMYSNVLIFDIKVVSSRAYCVSNGRTIATTLSWMSHSYSRKGIASLSENVECIERSSDEVYIWCISLQHIVIFFLVTQYYHYQPGVFENHLKWANWLADLNPD